MKKISLVLALVIIVSSLLVGCGNNDDVVTQVTKPAGYIDVNTGKKVQENASQNVETSVTEDCEDYDEDGNLIIISTDNRYVYLDEDGYTIFTFNEKTSACYQVLKVYRFTNEEAFLAHTQKNLVENMSTDMYSNVTTNGYDVIYTVALEHETLGKYLKGNKDTVTADYPENLKLCDQTATTTAASE